jgi:hypothetical protein
MVRLIQGGLVLATRSSFHPFDPGTGATIPIADPEARSPTAASTMAQRTRAAASGPAR